MTLSVEDIKQAVAALSEADFARFRDWFGDLVAERFDAEIARDIEQGKLDGIAAKALQDVPRPLAIQGVDGRDKPGHDS